MSGVLNLQKGREMGNSSGESGLQARPPIVARVPRAYLGLAFLWFFSLLLFRRVNNLRVFNATSSSIPTAPTIHLPDGWTLNKNTGGKKGQIGQMIRFCV